VSAGAERLRRVTRRMARRVDLTPLTRWRGTGTPPGIRTAKTTLAAVLSWQLAIPLPGGPPVLAPLTALLVTQVTVLETITGSLQRVGSVVAGVLVAVLFSETFGLHWWSLGLAVFASLALGQVLRLGIHWLEVPISALLVLAVGGQPGVVAWTRVVETLLGAGVGVAVNVVLAPPVYVQPAGEAIFELADDMARLLEDAGDDLTRGWSGAEAYQRLQRARELDRQLRRAREALGRAEDSLRLNPRHRRLGDPSGGLRDGLSTLEHATILLRGLSRSLVDLDTVTDGRGPDPELRAALAGLLGETGNAVRVYGELVVAGASGPPANEAPLRRALLRARGRRKDVEAAMLPGRREDPGSWQVHGALLANVDRLLAELDPEGRTWPGASRPS
jgi:Aromatic acid exporter family member 1